MDENNHIKQARELIQKEEENIRRNGVSSETLGSEIVRIRQAIKQLRNSSIVEEFKVGMRNNQLAIKYGLTPSRISQIVSGKER